MATFDADVCIYRNISLNSSYNEICLT